MCEFLILNTPKKYEKHKNFGNFSTLLSATFLGFINNLWLCLALANLNKQINIILLLAADSENEKQMPTEVVQFLELLVKMQDAHDMYPSCLDDDNETKWVQQWYKSHAEVCVSIKAKHYWPRWGKEVAWWFTWYTHSEIEMIMSLKVLHFLNVIWQVKVDWSNG